MAKSDVKALQRKLAAAGFNPGKIDGIMGPRTRRAQRAFEKASSKEPRTPRARPDQPQDKPTVKQAEDARLEQRVEQKGRRPKPKAAPFKKAGEKVWFRPKTAPERALLEGRSHSVEQPKSERDAELSDALRRTHPDERPKGKKKKNAFGRAIEGVWNRLSTKGK